MASDFASSIPLEKMDSKLANDVAAAGPKYGSCHGTGQSRPGVITEKVPTYAMEKAPADAKTTEERDDGCEAQKLKSSNVDEDAQRTALTGVDDGEEQGGAHGLTTAGRGSDQTGMDDEVMRETEGKEKSAVQVKEEMALTAHARIFEVLDEASSATCCV